MTVDEALALARQLGIERGDAQTLLGHLSGQGRAWLVTHGDAPVPGAEDLLRRLADGEPLARGLSAYAAPDVRRIAGHRSERIEALLGWRGRDEVVHRDDLVLL